MNEHINLCVKKSQAKKEKGGCLLRPLNASADPHGELNA
jgi:hypothetical protein